MGNELAVQKTAEMTFLDDDGSIVKFTKDGAMRSVMHTVTLSMNKGHMWQMYSGQPFNMTAEGYEYLNKYIGLKQVKEDKFILNDREYTNPYIQYDDYGQKVAGMQKCTVYGYDPSGNLQASSVLISYNSVDEITARFMQVTGQKNGSGKGLSEFKPRVLWESQKNDLAKKGWIAYDIDANMVLAVNTSHEKFMKTYQDIQEKRSNLEKKLQTVARRNAFRKHPAMGGFYQLQTMQKTDKNGKPVDVVSKLKVIQWVNVDKDEEETFIQKYMETGNIEEVSLTDQEPADLDDLSEEELQEVQTDVDVEEIIVKEDKTERDELTEKIKEYDKLGYKVTEVPYRDLDITELRQVLKRQKKESKND